MPWPRATNGTCARAQARTTACTSAADVRQHDTAGGCTQVRQRVALVGHELHRLAQHAVRAADRHELVEESVGHRLQIWPMVHSRTVRTRLDYGTSGLDVDLPDAA